MTTSFSYATDLLSPDAWPETIKTSPHGAFLKKAAELASDLAEATSGDADMDDALHSVFTKFSRLVPSIPDPLIGRPSYTRATWDLRALAAMVPTHLRLAFVQDSLPDSDGDSRWLASLLVEGGDNGPQLLHGRPQYGSAWTPNAAIARILLTGFIHLLAEQTQRGPVAKTGSTTTSRQRASA